MTFMYLYTYLYKYIWLTTLVPFLLIDPDIAKRDQRWDAFKWGHFLTASQPLVHKGLHNLQRTRIGFHWIPILFEDKTTHSLDIVNCCLNVCFGFNHEVGFMTHDPWTNHPVKPGSKMMILAWIFFPLKAPYNWLHVPWKKWMKSSLRFCLAF